MNSDLGIDFLKSKIENISNNDKVRLVNFAKAYPPKVRALLGAILEALSLNQLSESLKETINFLSRFEYGIPIESLPTIVHWNIRQSIF